MFQKMGIPFRQMHSWDYSGPYHGYDGFAIFARDMDMAINSPVWKLVQGALEERLTLRLTATPTPQQPECRPEFAGELTCLRS